MRSRLKNNYWRGLSKAGLLLLYLFLLAPQCNSRFYSVANFYVVSSHHSPAVSGNGKHLLPQASSNNADHLRLDKRYRNVSGYADYAMLGNALVNCVPPQCSFLSSYTDVPESPVIDRILTASSLRGPPRA